MQVIPFSPVHDVVVIGGGLAGSLIATLLARAGRSVAVIDCQASYPVDFRAEQIVGTQVDQLRKFGLLDQLLGGISPIRHALIARRGRVIGGSAIPHYGLTYEQLIARTRACLPEQVTLVVGKAVEIRTSFDRQSVVLANGRVVRSRLVIVATVNAGRNLVSLRQPQQPACSALCSGTRDSVIVSFETRTR